MPQALPSSITRFASGVNMLYVSVYNSTPNSDGLLLYPDSAIENLINMAHAQGMQVYAASGTPNWPADGCATTGDSDEPHDAT